MWTLRETSSGVSSGDLWGRDPCGTLTSASLSFTSSSRGRKTIPCKEMNLVHFLYFQSQGELSRAKQDLGFSHEEELHRDHERHHVQWRLQWVWDILSLRSVTHSLHHLGDLLLLIIEMSYSIFFLVTNIKLRNILAIFIYIEPSHKTLLYFSPVRALDNKTFTYITVFFISPLTIEVPIGINKPIVRETSPDWVMWMWMCGPGSIVSYCEQLGV